jgi:hypothetical protein
MVSFVFVLLSSFQGFRSILLCKSIWNYENMIFHSADPTRECNNCILARPRDTLPRGFLSSLSNRPKRNTPSQQKILINAMYFQSFRSSNARSTPIGLVSDSLESKRTDSSWISRRRRKMKSKCTCVVVITYNAKCPRIDHLGRIKL